MDETTADPTITLRFRVTKERMEELPLDSAIALEDMQLGENVHLRTMRDLFAHFLTAEDGAYLPDAEAQRRLGKLRINELKEVGKQFSDAVKEGVIPPASGGS